MRASPKDGPSTQATESLPSVSPSIWGAEYEGHVLSKLLSPSKSYFNVSRLYGYSGDK